MLCRILLRHVAGSVRPLGQDKSFPQPVALVHTWTLVEQAVEGKSVLPLGQYKSFPQPVAVVLTWTFVEQAI